MHKTNLYIQIYFINKKINITSQKNPYKSKNIIFYYNMFANFFLLK